MRNLEAPVPEQCLINHLHAEKMKRRKDAAEAKAERKRKRKARHDKASKLARAEGKPQPATPESSEEDEEEASDASDAEDHVLRGDREGARTSPPPFYLWDEDEGEPAVAEETRAAASSPRISTWGAGVSSPAAGGDDSHATPSREGFADGSAMTLVSSAAAGSPLSSSHR